jgi:hypothetical protein
MLKPIKIAVVLSSAVVAGVATSAAAVAAFAESTSTPPQQTADAQGHEDPGTGRGETLMLAVTGSYQTRAEAEAAAASVHFGDVQGMYVVPTDGLSVLGVYEQKNPVFVSSSCQQPRPEDVHVCESGEFASIRVQQEPQLRRVNGTAWRQELAHRRASRGQCAKTDAPPCVTDTFDRLLGEDGQFTPGQWLVTSGFRAKLGAEQFLRVLQAAGHEDAVAVRVKKDDEWEVGLGQEPHPDGSGPLLRPLREPERHQ